MQENGCFRRAWPCGQFLQAQRLSKAMLAPGSGQGYGCAAQSCIAKAPGPVLPFSIQFIAWCL